MENIKTDTEFGSNVVADFKVLTDEFQGIDKARDILVIRDLATRWTHYDATPSRSTVEVVASLHGFLKDQHCSRFHSDGGKEFLAAAKQLGIRHTESLPFDSQGNAFAERAIRTMTEGARAVLYRSGFPIRFWPMAAESFSIAHNLTTRWRRHDEDDDAPMKSPYERRYDGNYTGTLLPFGALCHARLQQTERRTQHPMQPDTTQALYLGPLLSDKGEERGNRVILLSDMRDAVKTGKTPKVHTVRNPLIRHERLVFPLYKRIVGDGHGLDDDDVQGPENISAYEEEFPAAAGADAGRQVEEERPDEEVTYD